MPAATLFTTHWMLVQANVRQAVSVPAVGGGEAADAGALAVAHRLVPQVVPAVRVGFDGTPAVTDSFVQSVAVDRQSALSFATEDLPLPSHWLLLAVADI